MNDVLEMLEKRVAEASSRLARLLEENEALRRRVAELDGELATRGGDGEAGWTKEREQIRKRVEKLAGRLEALLSP